jgi:hypothetical protein
MNVWLPLAILAVVIVLRFVFKVARGVVRLVAIGGVVAILALRYFHVL